LADAWCARMNRTRSLARNVVSNWFVLALSVAYVFFVTPIIVRALDTELYGVWSFLNGLLAYSALLYFGLGAAIIKTVARYRAENDLDGINRVTSIVLTIYFILGLCCFILFAGLSTVVPSLFATPLSADAARGASYACLLLGARLFLVFVGSGFSGLMAGHDRFDLVNVVNIVQVVVRFVLTPLLVRPGDEPLLALAWLHTAVEALQTICLAALSYWYVPTLSIRPQRPTASELRMLYGFGIQSFFIMFAVRLISYTDTTVIGLTLGASSVALYSLPLQLIEVSRLAIGGFSGVLLPRLTFLATTGDLAKLRQHYLDSARIGCFLFGWLAALVIALGPAFLDRWVGPAFGTPVQWVLVYLAIAGFGQVLTTQIGLGFYQSLHVMAYPAAVLTIEALINVLLSIWLARRFGITGVAFATMVPALLVSCGLLPAYLCRKLGIPVRSLLLQSVLPGVAVLASALAMLGLLDLGGDADSYTLLIIRVLMTVPVAGVVFLATFPPDQKVAVRRVLSGRF
jgi:O-antigen/teichoic acid export membrane protein